MRLTLMRDVMRDECPWLSRDYLAGEKVWRFDGHTYGCIGPDGIACRERDDTDRFFELPAAAVSKTEGGADAANQ